MINPVQEFLAWALILEGPMPTDFEIAKRTVRQRAIYAFHEEIERSSLELGIERKLDPTYIKQKQSVLYAKTLKGMRELGYQVGSNYHASIRKGIIQHMGAIGGLVFAENQRRGYDLSDIAAQQPGDFQETRMLRD